jgi:hypothetical protein
MVRIYKRKKDDRPTEIYKKALEHYINTTDGYKKTSQLFGIPRSTLHDYVKRFQKMPESERLTENLFFGYKKPRKVFTDDQEATIVTYLKHLSSIHFGPCARDVRVLAYECAKRFDIKMPVSWTEKEIAGTYWLSLFLKRHPELSENIRGIKHC